MNELMLVLPRTKTSKTLCSLPPTLMPSAFLNLCHSLGQWLTFTWLSKPAATKPRPGYNPVALHAHLCDLFWWHSAVRSPTCLPVHFLHSMCMRTCQSLCPRPGPPQKDSYCIPVRTGCSSPTLLESLAHLLLCPWVWPGGRKQL